MLRDRDIVLQDRAKSYLSIEKGGNRSVVGWGRSTRDERACFNPQRGQLVYLVAEKTRSLLVEKL